LSADRTEHILIQEGAGGRMREMHSLPFFGGDVWEWV
jgi:hypothetical protein